MKQNISHSWNDQWPVVCSTIPLPTGKGVIDSATSNTLELNALFNSVNQASTHIGQSVLYRSLICPLNSVNSVNEVLDELSERTTFEEKMESSCNVLDGFFRKGNSMILTTHNRQLIDLFNDKGVGIAKQVEFKNAPTYKLIYGIFRVSHPDRIAK